MNQLIKVFEEMSGNVLPSPMDDAYLDAIHMNYMVKCMSYLLLIKPGMSSS